MKKVNTFFLFLTLLCFLLVSIESPGQSKKALIREYKNAKENASKMLPFNKDNRMDFYQSMDLLPRIVWGKIEQKFLLKKQCIISDVSYLLVLYDYDTDGIADQFALQTLEGKNVSQEFGFMYDLNKDGKTDYVVYNGGLAMCKNEDFYYYFYHWIDSNFDGAIDAIAINVFVSPGDSLPDPKKVLWVMDTDMNGKPDLIDCIDIQNRNVNTLKASDGIWNYKDMFESKTVNSNDDQYFKFMNEYLKALNE